jgi:hypothetical protein
MYPVGLERLDQCFHFGQSIRLRQLGSRSRGVSTEQAVKRRYLVQPSDLFGYAVGSQQIAPTSVCPDDAQYRVPGSKFRCATRALAALANNPAISDFGHLAAPDGRDGTSAVGESRHRIPAASRSSERWKSPRGPGCVKSPTDAMILRVNRRAGALDVRLRGGD